MSYHTSCKKCGNTIFINEINGKWAAFEDSTSSTYHRCNDMKISSSVQERISSLEKIVRQLNDKIILQQENLDELNKRRI